MYFSPFVKSGHENENADIPWEFASIQNRLVKYIAGGGMMAFGRTVTQERRDRNQNRLFYAFGIFLVIDLIGYLV